MGLRKFMAGQLRQPRGWFGSLVLSRGMNRTNRRVTERALDLLELAPDHQVLEIGFGGAVGLASAVSRLDGGAVTGVDLSPEMVRAAERRFRREITAGRIRLQFGDIARLPFPDASFDRVFTINTIYFWTDTLACLHEIRRVLKPDGRAAVGLRSREKMQWSGLDDHGFRLFIPEEVVSVMQSAGFRDVSVDHRYQEKTYDDVVVLGTR